MVSPNHSLYHGQAIAHGGRIIALVVMAALSTLLMASSCGGGGGSDDGGTNITPSSVAGHLDIPDRVVLDYDVNDANNPTAPNNTILTAQAPPALVFAAGWADYLLDPEDYYLVHLNKGDEVVLLIADANVNQDLYLYRDDGVTLDDSSTSASSDVETVTGSTSGDFYVRVKDVTSSSIYRLALGVNSASVTADSDWSADQEFVPDQVIVKFKDQALSEAKTMVADQFGAPPEVRPAAAYLAALMGASLKEVDPRGVALLGLTNPNPLKSIAPNATSQAQLKARKQATLDLIALIAQNPDVEYAEPNFIAHPFMTPNDPYFPQMWALNKIHAPQAWDTTTGRNDVVVAIVDTGVLYNHPDLKDNILKDGSTVVGYDLISDPSIALDGNGIDPDPFDVGDHSKPDGTSSFHGTHCSGTVAATINNSIGVPGVAGSARIMPVRVLGKGGGTYYDIAQGILYAARQTNASGHLPYRRADVISMSLGGSSNSTTLQNAINQARNNGVIVIAAAGNDSSSLPHYPAACTGVVAVSAVNYAGNLAYYSNYGTYIDIAAPGGDTSADLNNDGIYDGILSTLGNDSGCSNIGCIQMTYALYQGTSMACPHVSGVVALMISAIKDQNAAATLTPQDFDDLVTGANSSDTVSSITNYPKGSRDNILGYGLIDAQKAINAALLFKGESLDPTPRLYLSPDQLSFGFSTSRLETLILNQGTDPLGTISVQPYSATWLSHILQGDTLIFDVDRGNSNDYGAYQQTVTVDSTGGGSATVNITMSVGEQVGSNIGIVYIILVDPLTLNTVYQVASDFDKGYAYKFSNIRSGYYLLAAGTDLDDDYTLGDNGEIFGVYPSSESPASIHVADSQTKTKINFPLQFVGLPVANAAGAATDNPQGMTLRRIK